MQNISIQNSDNENHSSALKVHIINFYRQELPVQLLKREIFTYFISYFMV